MFFRIKTTQNFKITVGVIEKNISLKCDCLLSDRKDK